MPRPQATSVPGSTGRMGIVLVSGERIILRPDVDGTAQARVIKAMGPMPTRARLWLVTGPTDMRKGFDGVALIVQETLKRDPNSDDLFVFRGPCGSLFAVSERGVVPQG